MRWLLCAVFIPAVSLAPATVAPANAASPVPVIFGASWDGPSHSLQGIVDQYLVSRGGSAGQINVQTDYVGAKIGELDPWFWVGSSIPAALITEVAGNADRNVLGWYKETGASPVIDGIDDGVVFNGPQGAGDQSLIIFPAGIQKFGFYLDPPQSGGTHQYFFTNRFYNDKGPRGTGATHAPFDGDVQAVVYDVSRFIHKDNTWLVCFEDLDAGLPITPCCSGTDDDYNDLVFEITALGATPTQPISFGALKAKFRDR